MLWQPKTHQRALFLVKVEMLKTKITTGVPSIDDLFEGGVARGSSVLMRAHPLVDVSIVAIQFLHLRLEDGDIGLYFVSNKSPLSVVEESTSIGLSVEKFKSEGSLAFIDAYSGLFGMKSDEEFSINTPADPVLTSKVVTEALVKKSKLGKVSLVFDSLNTSIDQCGQRVLMEVNRWNKIALVHDCIMCYLYTEWGYPTEISERVGGLFPNIVDFKTVERIIASQVLTVSKVDGQLVKRKMVPVRFDKPGGIKGYIPKILVTGPYHAGKTTLVHSLSTRAVSVQRMGTTVALDFGHVDHKGFSLDLFGTIGQSRFDPILKQLGGEALGVVLVVDSTKPEEFPRAKEMMHKAGVYGLPYVVAANKQDLPNALSVEQVRERMKIPGDVVIVGTVAMDKVSVLKVLDVLLDKIM